jgi:fructuronate reductase
LRTGARVPEAVDPAVYEEQLFTRWRNFALGHRTSQVGSDGSVKLRERIPHPALRLRDEGRMPDLMALTIAAYLWCLAPLDGFDPGPYAREMQDQARQWLTVLAADAASAVDLARRALVDRRLLGDEVAGWDAFIGRTGELVDVIRRRGPEAGAADAMAGAR